MKSRSWFGSSLLLGALAVACAQTGPSPEEVGRTEQGLGEPGCATVSLHAPGSTGDGNVGVASGQIGPCAGPITVSSDDYAGSTFCPSQAIVELDEGTSWYVPSVSPTTMPTTQADCTQMQVTMGVYGLTRSWSRTQRGSWNLLTTKAATGVWNAQASYCSFFSTDYFDTSAYETTDASSYASADTSADYSGADASSYSADSYSADSYSSSDGS